jgi:hypothetical protein
LWHLKGRLSVEGSWGEVLGLAYADGGAIDGCDGGFSAVVDGEDGAASSVV